MKTLKIIVALTFVLTVFYSCTGDDLIDPNTSVIRREEGELNDFDRYLIKKLRDPYNIDFSYKLKDVEGNQDFTLVPAEYEKSVIMANLLIYLCLEPFEKFSDENFLKENFPKQVVVIGSPGYNPNGTKQLGTAAEGAQIEIFQVNDLDLTKVEDLKESYFRVIFHEFSHILHQKKMYPVNFNLISAASYRGSAWDTTWGDGKPNILNPLAPVKPKAIDYGFISKYASNKEEDDFVELITYYLIDSETVWNNKLSGASVNGRSLINKKMDIIKKYLLKEWNLNLDLLKEEIQLRITNLPDQNLNNIN